MSYGGAPYNQPGSYPLPPGNGPSGYGAPPSGPPPQQLGGYQHPYGQPHQQPSGQFSAGLPLQQYGQPPPHQQYVQSPAHQPYGQHLSTQQYGQQSAQHFPVQQYNTPLADPTPPSPGYGAAQNINWSGDTDSDALRKAMKGFGTNEQELIRVLANRDPLQINMIRDSFRRRHGRDLEKDIMSETRGYFETGLVALCRGPLIQDCYVLHDAMKGVGTRESELNDVLLSRSNADLRAIKSTYQQLFRRTLESDLRGDLSLKTEQHFMIIAAANRAEDTAPVIPQQIDQDVLEIYKATIGKMGTDEIQVCSILSLRNDNQIRAISQVFEKNYSRSLDRVLESEFSGHMKSALLMQLRGSVDRALRDATLLEDAMKGMGTKDRLLVNRIVRYHWDKGHMQQVKGAYRHKYKQELSNRVQSETSGDYCKLMLTCIN